MGETVDDRKLNLGFVTTVGLNLVGGKTDLGGDVDDGLGPLGNSDLDVAGGKSLVEQSSNKE